MVVLINPMSGGGSGLRRWNRVEHEIRGQLGAFAPYVARDAKQSKEWITTMLDRGETDFVVAGGDGTLNFFLNVVLTTRSVDETRRIRIGAVGIGSSNDFHKPFHPAKLMAGIPCRIDFAATFLHDVGVLMYRKGDGVEDVRHWILNASIGITAEGNLIFNRSDATVRFLKRFSPFRGIPYATVRALAVYRPRPMWIAVGDEEPVRTELSNLGVVKNPHFTGSLRYDSPYEPASGCFYIHLCEGASRVELVHTLWRLTRGGFSGLQWTRSRSSDRLSVMADEPFAVEMDGELVRTSSARFLLKKRAIQVCR